MTVKELKEHLNKIEDENLPVVTYSSGEGGYEDVGEPEIIYIQLDKNVGRPWEGRHGSGSEEDTKAVQI